MCNYFINEFKSLPCAEETGEMVEVYMNLLSYLLDKCSLPGVWHYDYEVDEALRFLVLLPLAVKSLLFFLVFEP